MQDQPITSIETEPNLLPPISMITLKVDLMKKSIQMEKTKRLQDEKNETMKLFTIDLDSN